MRYLARLFPYLRGSRKLFVLLLIIGTLGQVTVLLLPKVVQQIIEQVLKKSPSHILPWALLILLLAVIKSGLAALETVFGIRLGQRVLRDLRQDIYDHLCKLKLGFFDKIRSGELLSRVTADLDPIDGFFSWGSRLIFRNVLLFIGVVIFCLSMNPRLTLVSLVFIPLISGTAFVIGLLLRPAWQAAREQVGLFSSALEETLSGIRVVKMSVQEKNEIAKLTRASESVRQKTFGANRLDAAYYPLTGFWGGIAGLAILAYGGLQVINHSLTIEQYVAFELYLLLLLVPMRMLGWMVSGVQRAAVGAQRIVGLLDEAPEDLATDSATGTEQAYLEGSISFDQVNFGYRPGEPVLKNLNLKIKAGEIVGLLGPTGSGKSALVALIPRLYDPQQGRVLIDGKDVRDYDLRWLRRQVGMVFQESFLFSATIRENIAFGRPDASQEEIEQAARRAALHDFIVGLEEGYDTLVGERGLNLSGGQQQRLALARTLLMDPRILILDDCTSSVDADTEFQIQQELAQLMASRTSLIIAQRASSVATANHIIVFDQGHIVEEGTPEQLAARPGGLYQRLLEVQKSLGLAPSERPIP